MTKNPSLEDQAPAPAPELAKDPNILDRFVADVRGHGLVGEDRNAKIIFLATTSRLLERPVSIIVKGASGGGKSFTVQCVLDFFPGDAYCARTAMSTKSLYYGEEPLKNRVLVIYEAVGMENSSLSYALRSILSENKLVYEVVEGGKTRTIERPGPTGLIVTTTKESLHPENETRMLSLTVKDTPEQTAQVLRAMAVTDSKSIDLTKWHALQGYLASCKNDVVIPFAESIMRLIPPCALRLRRDIKQVVSLIKTHAVLHQKTRERDEAGHIIATLKDYAVVHGLIGDIIAEGIEAMIPVEVMQAVEAVSVLHKKHPFGVTYKEVGAYLKLDKSSAKRRCDDAISRGHLLNNQNRKNQPAQLILGEPLPEDREILPKPEDVQRDFMSSNNGCAVARKIEEGVCDAEAA